MRKRLRKKKHLGEFKEFGCELIIERNTKSDFNEFLYAFIDDAIEANDCYCGGGGKEDHWEFIIELGCQSDKPEGRLKKICNWLDGREDVKDYKTGELIDLWYGEFFDD
jgi:hypothetical protein